MTQQLENRRNASPPLAPGRFSLRWRIVRAILRRWESLEPLPDRELTAYARSLAYRARAGATDRSLLVDGFAAAAESVRRTLSIRMYPVQLYAGVAMNAGCIVEMQTGEGKTVTAVPPVFVRALEGLGCHVMTANEYLAQRDADKLRPAYELLGLTVSCVKASLEPPQRKAAYDCDVTYGTANEFGFDYLRDRLKIQSAASDPAEEISALDAAGMMQRGRHFAMVDEADSILLDEGRTPLIIALPTPLEDSLQDLLHWSHKTASELAAGRHFLFDEKTRQANLTHDGCNRVLLTPRPASVCRYDVETLYQRVETSLQACWAYQLDRDYVIKPSEKEKTPTGEPKPEVQIVDESTGRVLDGRRWQKGLHQAIEIREGLPPSADHGIAARITMQRYISLYPHVAGMTGTAWTAKSEFRSLYQLSVHKVPTNRRNRRIALPHRVFRTQAAKYAAIAESIREYQRRGRAILVGTPSIVASEHLSAVLIEMDVPHRLLNARQDSQEATIIAAAGHPGTVTIATNMAGRGTDIELEQAVRDAGGLHVIATEIHSSRRIDRQLVGRAARQGDPGSYQFFVSLEDELFELVPRPTRDRWKRLAAAGGRDELSSRRWLGVFLRTQRGIERRHARDRRLLRKLDRRRWTTCQQMGLDPCLDLAEET